MVNWVYDRNRNICEYIFSPFLALLGFVEIWVIRIIHQEILFRFFLGYFYMVSTVSRLSQGKIRRSGKVRENQSTRLQKLTKVQKKF